tara:strand:+ start:273 stop:2063 length:1791 start_codon:yes stop_codon:yes gene_type:complete
MFKSLNKIFRAAYRYNSLDLLPLIGTLRNYRLAFLKDDIKSGINVALLAFPQGMAYALIAGLPIHYGIIGSAIATIACSLFAKSNLITFGPTNATAVMLFSAFAALEISGNDKLEYLSTLILLVGIFTAIGAYFKIAHLIKYVSRSVITGYITAAAFCIILNQLPKVLGININEDINALFPLLWETITHLDNSHLPTLTLSALTFISYYLLNKRFNKLPNIAIVLVSVSAFTFFAGGADYQIIFLQPIGESSWSYSMPNIDFEAINMLTSTAIAIALLCILEGVSIGKSLAVKKSIRLDPNQAMYSIGMANIACSFFSGMPASGSLTRSSLNYNSGSQTVISNLFCGVFIILGVIFIGSSTEYIPVCSLAVLVIIVGISLINKHAIRVVTRTTRSDAFVFFATLLSGLYFPLDTAIYCGVGISILFFLKKVAEPELKEYSFTPDGLLAESLKDKKRTIPEISIVHIEGELFFGASDLLSEQVRRIYEEPQLKIVILKMRNAHHMDASSVMSLEELIKHMNDNGRYLILSEVREDLLRVLNNSGISAYIEQRNIFLDDSKNPTLSTSKALKRAKEHLGEIEPNISIYVDSINKEIKP